MLMMRFTVALIVFVLVVNVWFARPILESILFAVALAVGLTPELLPMIVTVTLARSAMQMAKRKVIVKRLSAIHDVGAMNVLCTDKTGTLTEAKIKLLQVIDGSGAESANAFSYAYVNSKFETGIKSPLDEAILSARPFDMTDFKKIDEAPFDFERRRVSVLVEHGGKRGLFVKGAPEDMLRLSSHYQDADAVVKPLNAERRADIQATLDGLGAQGLRALGIASRLASSTPGTANRDSAVITDETDMVFAGFAVFLDPPKASAGVTIRDLEKAGVTVKVVTGDNELVSRHVFAEIGVPVTGVLSGETLDRISDEALIGQLPRTNLFCRINPQQKHQNPAGIKAARRCRGIHGGRHQRRAGAARRRRRNLRRRRSRRGSRSRRFDSPRTDLAVVGDAVAAGRAAVQNVTKYVLMGASSNFGNMFSMAGATLILPFLPMLPIQILLNNLIYNVSEIAIPFDNVDPETVVNPLKWDIKLIERFMMVFGPVSSIFDFITFWVLLSVFHAGEGLFQTGWFVKSMVTQTLVVFCIRTRRLFVRSKPGQFLTLMNIGAVAVAIALPFLPFVGVWFGFVALPPFFFAFLVIATLAYLGLVELTKYVFYRYVTSPSSPTTN